MKDHDFETLDDGLKTLVASLAGSAKLLVIVAIAASSAYLLEKLLMIVQLLAKGV
jgi:hypothetical protein